MRLNELSDRPGANRTKKRLGRGIGSGKGKTAGKGVKGQKARSGVAINGFEGGQMPLHRRLPKRGFTNVGRARYAEVGLDRIEQAIVDGKLDAGATIDAAALKAAGLVRRELDGVRVLGGTVGRKLALDVAGASGPAKAAVEAAGGTITVPTGAAAAEQA